MCVYVCVCARPSGNPESSSRMCVSLPGVFVVEAAGTRYTVCMLRMWDYEGLRLASVPGPHELDFD